MVLFPTSILAENMIVTKRIIKDLVGITVEYSIAKETPEVAADINVLLDESIILENNVQEALNNNQYSEMKYLNDKISELKRKIDSNSNVAACIRHKYYVDISRSTAGKKSSSKSESFADKYVEMRQEILTTLEKQKQDEVKEFWDQIKIKLDEEYSAKFEELKLSLKKVEGQLETTQEECKIKDQYLEYFKEEFKVDVTYKQIEDIMTKHKGTSTKIDKNFKLHISHSIFSDQKLVADLSKYKLPAIKRVSMDYLSSENEELNKFFEKSRPLSLELFNLNRQYNSDLTQCKYYLENLKKWFEITTREIYIENLKVNSSELSTIIKSSSQCQSLTIRFSSIDMSEDLDFKIDLPYKMTTLSFYNSGLSGKSEWNDNSTTKVLFTKFFKAVSESGLGDSLLSINFSGTGMPIANIQTIATEAGLKEGLIISLNHDPLID